MSNFFSNVQGKFNAKHHGTYLGNILEQIAFYHPEIAYPFFKYAGLKYRKNNVFLGTEYSYLKGEGSDKARRADLLIESDFNEKTTRILVEIKIKDGFLDGQIDDYCDWVSVSNENEDRGVLIVTAYPLSEDAAKNVEFHRKNNKNIRHIYLSEYNRDIKRLGLNSDLVTMFTDYLSDEGYAMYQALSVVYSDQDPVSAKEHEKDYDSLLSFMVLNFLPHASGRGRVSTSMKIANGPLVFSKIVQNWQIVSDRFARNVGMKRRPTIRYFPEQNVGKYNDGPISFNEDAVLVLRRGARKDKSGGRYWLTADCLVKNLSKNSDEENISKNLEEGVLEKEQVDDNVRLEWGQLIQIRHGNEVVSDGGKNEVIECALYMILRLGREQVGGAVLRMSGGIKDEMLYDSDLFIGGLFKLLKELYKQPRVKSMSPELASIVRG